MGEPQTRVGEKVGERLVEIFGGLTQSEVVGLCVGILDGLEESMGEPAYWEAVAVARRTLESKNG